MKGTITPGLQLDKTVVGNGIWKIALHDDTHFFQLHSIQSTKFTGGNDQFCRFHADAGNTQNSHIVGTVDIYGEHLRMAQRPSSEKL